MAVHAKELTWLPLPGAGGGHKGEKAAPHFLQEGARLCVWAVCEAGTRRGAHGHLVEERLGHKQGKAAVESAEVGRGIDHHGLAKELGVENSRHLGRLAESLVEALVPPEEGKVVHLQAKKAEFIPWSETWATAAAVTQISRQ